MRLQSDPEYRPSRMNGDYRHRPHPGLAPWRQMDNLPLLFLPPRLYGLRLIYAHLAHSASPDLRVPLATDRFHGIRLFDVGYTYVVIDWSIIYSVYFLIHRHRQLPLSRVKPVRSSH